MLRHPDAWTEVGPTLGDDPSAQLSLVMLMSRKRDASRHQSSGERRTSGVYFMGLFAVVRRLDSTADTSIQLELTGRP